MDSCATANSFRVLRTARVQWNVQGLHDTRLTYAPIYLVYIDLQVISSPHVTCWYGLAELEAHAICVVHPDVLILAGSVVQVALL